STSTVRGVFGIADFNVYHANRFLSYTAPMPNAVPPLAPGCTGLSQGNLALQYIKPTWIPDPSPTYGAILPGGVSMGGFKRSNPTLGDATPTSTDTYDPSYSTRVAIAKNVADNLARGIRRDPAFDIRIHTI